MYYPVGWLDGFAKELEKPGRPELTSPLLERIRRERAEIDAAIEELNRPEPIALERGGDSDANRWQALTLFFWSNRDV